MKLVGRWGRRSGGEATVIKVCFAMYTPARMEPIHLYYQYALIKRCGNNF